MPIDRWLLTKVVCKAAPKHTVRWRQASVGGGAVVRFSAVCQSQQNVVICGCREQAETTATASHWQQSRHGAGMHCRVQFK